MVASRERARGRLLIALALAGVLGLALLAALAPAPAQAGCSICDEYTLDMPETSAGSGGTFDSGGSEGSSGSTPAPAPTTTPAPSAPTTTTTVPETTTSTATTEPAATTTDKEPAEAAPEPFVPVRVDGPPETGDVVASKPLHYEGEDSAPAAALAGLGSPGTIALLAALIAAGAAVAVGRRRAPAS
jgi:hypothetical protein